MISLIFNNLSAATVAALMHAYKACPDYDETQNPSISMSARDYLEMLDNPAFGADTAPSAAAVFSAGASTGDLEVHVPPVSAAAAFGNANLTVEPVISMTEKAEGLTLQSFYDQGWTNDSLVEHGYIVITQPAAPVYGGNGGPNGPAATGTPPAPVPASASTPAALRGAPQNTDAPAHVPVRDTDGIPWDERIHASTRTMVKAGTWTKRKGIDAAVYATITEELRLANTKPFTPLNGNASATGAAPPPSVAANTASANAAPPPPSSASAAPPPPADAATTGGAPATFKDFCKFVTGGGFKADQIIGVCNQFGIPGLGRLSEASNSFLFEPMYEAFMDLKK